MQVPNKAQEGISDSLADEVVADRTDVDGPVIGQVEGTTQLDRVGQLPEGGRSPVVHVGFFGIELPLEAEVEGVTDAEFLEQAKQVRFLENGILFLPSLSSFLFHVGDKLFLRSLEQLADLGDGQVGGDGRIKGSQ